MSNKNNFNSINDNEDFSYCNIKTLKKFYNFNNYYDIHMWYIKHIDRLLYYNNRHCRIKILQKGNGKKEVINKIIIYKNKGINYRIKISHFVSIDEYDGEIAMIYLMEPITSDKPSKKCITVKIEKGDSIAYIDDVNSQFKCTDQKSNPKNAGSIFLQIIMKYLKKNKNILGINRIELTDNSRKIIKTGDVVHDINLFKSRQLENKIPYYMKFGFFPVLRSTYHKLKKNYNRILNLLTKDINFITILLVYKKHKLNQALLEKNKKKSDLLIELINLEYDLLIDYLESNANLNIKNTIEYIRINFQIIYNNIYLKLFEVIGLEDLLPDETVYYLNI